MRYGLYELISVMTLLVTFAPPTALGGLNDVNNGTSLRDSRSDCNTNGIADEDEVRPLDGHALVFDGAGDYVDPGASTALANLGQGDFTIEAWIRTDHPGGGILVSNANNTSALYNFVVLGDDNEGRIRLRIKNGATSYTCTSTVRINDGDWHHVAASRWMSGAGSIRLYVDGEEYAMLWGNYDMEPFTADYPTLIGRDQYASPHYFTGAMDEVRVWSVGRYSDDIQADMYRVLDGTEPGLVAYWRFDEGTGSVAYDSAGNSDGTVVGSPAWAPYSEDCNGNETPDECDTIVDGVIYVDDDATSGLNDGLSWANAFVDLQDAMAFAKCDNRITEIRVAGGTYKPGTSRGDSFYLQQSLALRGGYRGLAGGGEPGDRDIDAFESILSGDIGEIGEPSDNCRHVVFVRNGDVSSVIEGFTITEGYASGTGDYHSTGGGMYIDNSSPTISQCKFVANWGDRGGGLYNNWSNPTLTACKFRSNSARTGGGIYHSYSVTTPLTIANCTFRGNSVTQNGGGICCDYGSMMLENCTFSGNSAISDGGGVHVRNYNSYNWLVTLVNCTLSGNSSGEYSGGIYVGSLPYSRLHVKNCVLWGNTAIYGNPQLKPSSNVTFSCVQGGYAGAGNIDADPLFVDAAGPDGIFGTEDDDLHLLEGSPCINAGKNGLIPSGVTSDFEGEDRIQQCRVDMGADESPFLRNDCNSNGVSDACDIEAGASLDDDGDGVPDECQLFGDCDHDLDVDLDDFNAMSNCLSGPGAGLGNDCDCFDSDGDSDVDLADFAVFQYAFGESTGPR